MHACARLLFSGLLATDGFECLLECGDEVADVLDCSVLVVEPVVHLFLHVAPVFLELTQSVLFDLLDSVALPLQFVVKFVDEFTLLLKPLFLFLKDGFLNLSAVLSKVVKDLPLLGDPRVALIFQLNEVLLNLCFDWLQLVVKALHTVLLFFLKHVFKTLHAVVASLVFALLIV